MSLYDDAKKEADFGGPFGINTSSLGAIQNATQSLASDPSDYIQSGEDLFNNVSSLSQGSTNGAFAALGGLVNDLPQGQVKTIISDALHIGESAVAGVAAGAAIGAMIGSAWPGIGTAVGAAVGVVIGVVEDLINGPAQPPQNDAYRGLADRSIFPETANGAPYSVIPGMVNGTPRAYPDSSFYETVGDGDWSLSFNFGITYLRPPGNTANTQDIAWALAQWYIAADNVTQMNALSPATHTKNPGAYQKALHALQTARASAATAAGDDPAAIANGANLPTNQMFARIATIYGALNSFSTVIPFSSPTPPTPADAQSYQALGILHTLKGGGGQFNNFGSAAGPAAQIVFNQFKKYPNDYLYYPILTSWNGQTQVIVDPTHNPHAVCMSANLLLPAVCECIAIGHDDKTILNWLIGLAIYWKHCKEIDAIDNPLVDKSNDQNLMRIIGILTARIRSAKGLPPRPAMLTKSANSGTVVTKGGTVANPVRPVIRPPIKLPPVTPVSKGNSSLLKWIIGILAAVGGIKLLQNKTDKRE